jgi:hypothetical protein
MVSGWYKSWTHHAESADELLWRLNASGDDHLDEVGCDADDDNHADGLEDADHQEHLAQRHGSVAWDRHFG